MLKKARSRRYITESITDAANADDLALLANAPAQDEYLLNSLEQAAEVIVLYMNASKMEHII